MQIITGNFEQQYFEQVEEEASNYRKTLAIATRSTHTYFVSAGITLVFSVDEVFS